MSGQAIKNGDAKFLAMDDLKFDAPACGAGIAINTTIYPHFLTAISLKRPLNLTVLRRRK